MKLNKQYLLVSKLLQEDLTDLQSGEKDSILQKVKDTLETKYSKHFTGIEIGVTAATIYLVLNLLIFILFSRAARYHSKLDEKLTKKIRELVPGRKWNVRIFGDVDAIRTRQKYYNAFTFTMNDIFVSSDMYLDFTEDEIIAVCLHEVGHAKERHVFISMAIGSPVYGLILSAFSAGIGVGIFFLIFGWYFYNYFASTWVTRRMEWRADDFAVKKGYGKALASGLKKLALSVKYKPCTTKSCRRLRWLNGWLHDHPDIYDRIEYALKKASKYIEQKNKFIAKFMWEFMVYGKKKQEVKQK